MHMDICIRMLLYCECQITSYHNTVIVLQYQLKSRTDFINQVIQRIFKMLLIHSIFSSCLLQLHNYSFQALHDGLTF